MLTCLWQEGFAASLQQCVMLTRKVRVPYPFGVRHATVAASCLLRDADPEGVRLLRASGKKLQTLRLCVMRAIPLRGKARNWQEAAHKARNWQKAASRTATGKKLHNATVACTPKGKGYNGKATKVKQATRVLELS